MKNREDNRLLFIAAALNGLCSHMPEFGQSHENLIAVQSIDIADAIMNRLEKEEIERQKGRRV